MSFLSTLAQQMSHHSTQGLFNTLTTGLERTITAAIPMGIPNPMELARLHKTGWFSESWIGNMMRMNGFKMPNFHAGSYNYARYSDQEATGNIFPLRRDLSKFRQPMTPIEALLWTSQYVPSIDELNFLRNRGLITPELHIALMQMATEYNTPMAYAWVAARYEIPSMSDLVHFMTREAFTPELVELHGMHHEFPRRILEWSEKLGFNQDLGEAIPNGATYENHQAASGNLNWAWLHWISHWDLPSVGQGFEFLFRLYRDSPYGPSPDSNNRQVTFTEDEMQILLRMQNYSDFWRKKLIAINYRPYTRIDVRRMYQLGTMDDATAYHSFRAQGYDNTRSLQLLNFTKKQKELKDQKDAEKESKRYNKLYLDGFITLRDLRGELLRLGVGPVGLERTLHELELEWNTIEYKQSLKALQKEFDLGLITIDGLRQQLSLLGLAADGIERQIRIFIRNLVLADKRVSAEKIITWYKKGIISEQETAQRLFNLRFESSDISRMIIQAKTEVLTKQQAMQQKAIQKIIKELEKQQKEQIAAAKKAVAERNKEIQAEVKIAKQAFDKAMAPFTQKNILDWAKKKLFTPIEIRDILLAKGWRIGTITTLLLANNIIDTPEVLKEKGINVDATAKATK